MANKVKYMIDSIGLGDFLVNFGVLFGVIVFAVAFGVGRIFFKRSLMRLSMIAAGLGVIGFFSSPFIFLAYMRLSGYSL